MPEYGGLRELGRVKQRVLILWFFVFLRFESREDHERHNTCGCAPEVVLSTNMLCVTPVLYFVNSVTF